MFNAVSYGIESQTLSTAALTLGTGPGQTAPPRFLLIVPTATTTITLPAIPPGLPTPIGTPGTSPGIGDGFMLTIRNGLSPTATQYAVSVVAASGDTLTDPLPLGYGGNQATLYGALVNRTWYNLTPNTGNGAYRAVGAPVTVAATDRYLQIGTAGTVTLLAPSAYPVGIEFVTLLNDAGVTFTIAPASGNINGTSTITITATDAGVLSDGTAYHLTHK